jgi:hypothetical protein
MRRDSGAGTGTSRRELDYHRAVGRLLQDYQESYSPDAAEQEWRAAPGGENDPYGGPFYRSVAEAREAADLCRSSAEQAAERAWQAEADARTLAARLDAARASLERASPWRWRQRARLHGQVARTEESLAEVRHDIQGYACSQELELELAEDAEWIAAVLQRHENALRASEAAVSRPFHASSSPDPGTAARRRGHETPYEGVNQDG